MCEIGWFLFIICNAYSLFHWLICFNSFSGLHIVGIKILTLLHCYSPVIKHDCMYYSSVFVVTKRFNDAKINFKRPRLMGEALIENLKLKPNHRDLMKEQKS